MAPDEGGPQPNAASSSAVRRFWSALVGIAVLAAAVRLLLVLGLPNLHGFPGGDGFYYLTASDTLATTGELGTTAANGVVITDVLHPPLYTAVLAAARALGIDSIEGLRLVSSALGIATVILTGLAGRRLRSPATGLVAAAIVAVSPAFWTYERNLNAEAVTFPLIAATILLAYRYRDRPSLGRIVALGAVGGLLALARTEQVLTVAVIVLVLALTTAGTDLLTRLLRVLAAGVAVLVVIAPWTIYNLGRFEQPVLLSAGSGNAMSAGACDTTFDGDRMGWYDEGCHAGRFNYFTDTDRTVQDSLMRGAAIAYTREHLGRLPAVVVAREGRTWSFFRVGQQVEEQAKAVDTPTWVIWLQTALFWVLVPIAVVGAVLLERRGVALTPLLAFPAVGIFTVAITFGDIRYRAPAEVPLVLLAAAGAVLLAERWTGRSEPTDDGVAEPVAAPVS